MPTNRLANEKSPYLLQHAHNPVDWRPWGEEAFRRAREEDKPIFLSVGYSTCHWCHVMERESFESEKVAAILNRHFIPIKVDREERPDIDRIYMLFVQATTGSGGWPMSVWLTPDLKPFYGGTYFPPDSRYGRPGFAHLLEQIAKAWLEQREKVEQSGAAVLNELARVSAVRTTGAALEVAALDSVFSYFRRTFDTKFGGFGGAPKFPRPSVFQFLLRYYKRAGNKEALEMTLLTLREMAKGGMRDQLRGGFHRYSVDVRWFVPHFEKMLYDQAQLAVSYIEAFQLTRDPQYAEIARDTFEYVLRDLTHPEGGFYSAEDADSIIDPAHPHEKREGAFYVWKYSELESLLGARRVAWFAYRYGCEHDGNVSEDPHGEFSGANILFEANSLEAAARKFDVALPEIEEEFRQMRSVLLEARARRPRPHLDDKILTSWNGLMISALARGARVLEESYPAGAARYIEAAQHAAGFVLEHLYDESSATLYRRWRDGERAVEGFLDDYAAFTQALIDLYGATFDTTWLDTALRIAARMRELFEDREHGGFYSTTGASDLVMRLKEDYDGAEPSGNSMAIQALLELAQYTGNGEACDAAVNALRVFASRLMEQGPTVPYMLGAWMHELSVKPQVVIAGDRAHPLTGEMLAEVRRRFLPFTALMLLDREEDRERMARWTPAVGEMREVDGTPAAHVCQDFTCRLPVTSVEGLAELLD